MVLLKRFSLATIGLVMMLLVAACGGTTTTGSGSTPTAAPTTAPAAVIKTASATVDGKSATILTDAKGMTLYYFFPDTATTGACTQAPCSTNWPPALFTGTGQPTAAAQLPGTLATLAVPAGNQVTYNGHLLYTFAGDTAAGQTNGEGKGKVWFVATTDLSKAILKTAQATVGGKTETILTDENGMTLYYFTPDTATTSACTGGCATSWPPLLFSATGQPTPEGLSKGTLAVLTDANGSQVTFNGHLLYTFAGDTAAGQTNGQGKGGKWFVATTDLAVMQ